ncbi:unnamed protein product, partial [Meganyctiphanes norvegica]
GRSKSLTHINTLGAGSDMLSRGESMEAGGPHHETLGVPSSRSHHHSFRRKKLSVANRVSSGEYVVMLLECFTDPVEEFVPAHRGTTLRSALERLQVDVNIVTVHIEGSRTIITPNTDLNLLGGKTIRVKGRDDSRSPQRSRSVGAPSSGGRRTPIGRGSQGRFMWGASTEEYPLTPEQERPNGSILHDKGQSKHSKHTNKWSIFPAHSKDSKMDSMVQQLDLYSKMGIPDQPHLLVCQTIQQELSLNEAPLESSWRQVVDGADLLDARQEQQQSAIWELVETEATYIHNLKDITDLFLACLCNLQNESLLNEIDTDKLFSNIQEIYAANLTFWREHIMRMLEHSRLTRQPLDPTILAEAFYKFEEIYKPYTRYCLEQSNCQLYCKEKNRENEYFKLYLAWCETQRECNRLRLVDILVQPMQRLFHYSVLLKAILKKTSKDDHRFTLQEMIGHVETFLTNVNSTLRQCHEQERLKDIAKRIETYDVVESRDDDLERVIKTYSELNLTQPMPGCPEHLLSHLLLHGDLKLSDNHISKTDVHVFLFTDLLLITKVTQRKAEKVKIVRPPYLVARLILVEVKDCTSIGLVSINEWNVAVAAFTLQCHDHRTHKSWLDQLRRAQEHYREAQQARDVLVYDDTHYYNSLYPRSPRGGSSRASRMPSLAHSHSGSIDLNEALSVFPTWGIMGVHHPSIDLSDVRASSMSSDGSISPRCHVPDIQRSRSLDCSSDPSVRDERHTVPTKTPNTLSVNPPYPTGQSLPNLISESSKSLKVPTSHSVLDQLSPREPCVSYQPRSRSSLQRASSMSQSRNPPLVMLRNKQSSAISPQTHDHADILDDYSFPSPRISHLDRLDNYRYHTPGAIEDLKSSRGETSPEAPHPSRSKHGVMDPLSPGVSAASSLYSLVSLVASQAGLITSMASATPQHMQDKTLGTEVEVLEPTENINGKGNAHSRGEYKCFKISPSTYSSKDSDITFATSYLAHSHQENESRGRASLDNPRNVKIRVPDMDLGLSSVQITINEGSSCSTLPSPFSSSSSLDGGLTEADSIEMGKILLRHPSIEATDI